MKVRRPTKTLTADEILRVAGAASCDPRTVTKYLAGQEVRGKVRDRIVEAIEKLER